MKTLIIALLSALFTSLFTQAADRHPQEHQLVSVLITSQSWNEYRPWQKQKPSTRTFSGMVIEGNRILILSDDIDGATLIQVEKFDRPPRIPARVIHCDYQLGLAVITVDQPGFFDDLNPLHFAEDMSGEDYYCITWMSGQLSYAACRWAQAQVYDSGVPYLSYPGIEFITDLTSGGWGEPVLSGDNVVGIGTSQSENSLTVLPTEIIQAYLKALARPDYPGFAWLGIRSQSNKGPAQAAYVGLTGPPTGIRIRNCFPNGSADGILLPGDILLELDGHTIDSLGDYMHPQYGSLDVNLIPMEGHLTGDIIPAKILRNKQEMNVLIPLKNTPPSAALIPEARKETPPPYLVAGGLIFRELDESYLQAWGDEWYDKIPHYLRILYSMKRESATPDTKRLIILADVFPDEYNLGYHDMAQNIVKTVNGVPVDSIRKMEDAFQHPTDGFHVIEFVPSFGTSKVILDAATFDATTQSIMEKYQIPSRIRLNETAQN